MALFDARSVAHMPAITFTNLYILYLLWHYQWQDCAAGIEQRAARSSSIDLLPTCPLLLLSHFGAHTSLSLPLPEPQSAMTRHGQNCMLIASSQLQTKPKPNQNQTKPHSYASSSTRGRATPQPIQISIEIGNLCARIMQATTPNHSHSHSQSQRITDSDSKPSSTLRPGRQSQITI